MRALRPAAFVLAACIVTSLGSRGRASPALSSAPASPSDVPASSEEAFAPWAGASFGTYMVPNGPFVADDGGFDLVVHFHAAHMAEGAWRRTGLPAVVASMAFGIGSGAYYKAFEDPARFGAMLGELARRVSRAAGRKAHVRRVALVAWSAGYGAVDRILAAGRYASLVDSVVLLDAMHAGYKRASVAKPDEDAAVVKERLAAAIGLGADAVDTKMLAPFVTFAREAVAGEKLFVFTHSSIRPTGYASTSECAVALGNSIGVVDTTNEGTSPLPWPAKGGIGVAAAYAAPKRSADAGGLHVRGYAGGGPADHLAHLPLVESVVREFLAPRWAALPPVRTASR